MKLVIKTVAVGLVFSVLTAGVASAMIPSNDLKINRFADEGVSAKLLSDIDSGLLEIREKAPNQGLSELKELPDSATLGLGQLGGKHLI